MGDQNDKINNNNNNNNNNNIDEPKVYFISTQRSKQKLIHNDYTFLKERVHNNISYWKCQNFHSRCRARVSYRIETGQAKLNNEKHNHPPDRSQVEIEKIYDKIRNEALITNKSLEEIFKKNLANIPKDLNVEQKFNVESIKRKMKKMRKISKSELFNGNSNGSSSDSNDNNDNGNNSIMIDQSSQDEPFININEPIVNIKEEPETVEEYSNIIPTPDCHNYIQKQPENSLSNFEIFKHDDPVLPQIAANSIIIDNQEMMTPKENPDVIVLFDVDGTLTKPRANITLEMFEFLQKLQKKVTIGLVGGSDLNKIAEQMYPPSSSDNPKDVIVTPEQQVKHLIQSYDYVFAENGLVAYHQGQLIAKQSILEKMGESGTQHLINFVLDYFSKLSLPVKRGNFIEFRNGLINVSPIGRSCSRQERNDFFEYDKQHGIRKKLVEALENEFKDSDVPMEFALGGQISIDCYPKGWDKRFCLQFVEKQFQIIYFFGDRTEPGGNDHHIFEDSRTIGHSVKSPEETKEKLIPIFFK